MGVGHGRGAFAPLKHDLKPLALQAGVPMRAITVTVIRPSAQSEDARKDAAAEANRAMA